jgi:hypothetical protein
LGHLKKKLSALADKKLVLVLVADDKTTRLKDSENAFSSIKEGQIEIWEEKDVPVKETQSRTPQEGPEHNISLVHSLERRFGIEGDNEEEEKPQSAPKILETPPGLPQSHPSKPKREKKFASQEKISVPQEKKSPSQEKKFPSQEKISIPQEKISIPQEKNSTTPREKNSTSQEKIPADFKWDDDDDTDSEEEKIPEESSGASEEETDAVVIFAVDSSGEEIKFPSVFFVSREVTIEVVVQVIFILFILFDLLCFAEETNRKP